VTVTTPPGLGFSAASYSVSEAGPAATITVVRTGGLTSTFTVQYATSDGSAFAGSDYSAKNGTLTFGPGILTQAFTVPITDDAVVDEFPAETVNLTLTNPTGGAGLGSRPTAVLKIVDNDLGGTIQFGAATYSGTEGGPPVQIVVTRTGGAASGPAVFVETEDGTAQAGSDYTPLVALVQFGVGETTKTVPLTILDDSVGEDDETVHLGFSSVFGGAKLGPRSTAVLTIHDNEPVIQFSASTYTVRENAGSALIQVKRSGNLATPVTVSYETGNGTAVSPADYAAQTGTLTFAPGVTLQTFKVPIVNDMLAEGQETLTLFLTGTTGGALGPRRSALLNITDDDAGGVIQFSASAYSVNEAAVTATITVTRTGGLADGVQVSYATFDGTAVQPWDYGAASGWLTFAAGQTSRTFNLTIQNDSAAEGSETVTLRLADAKYGATLGARSTAVLTIMDDEAYAALGAATYSVTEGGTAVITVKRVGSTAAGVTVSYATSDGTATAPGDYAARSGTLTFPAGVNSLTFSVPTVNDTAYEGDETVNVMLTGASGIGLGAPNVAVLTIKDDDLGGVVQFGAAKYTVAESAGWATVTVTRSGGKASGVTVEYEANDGSATAGSDYTANEGTLTFGAGETTKTLTIPITDDWLAEGNETFALEFWNVTGGATLGARATTTVEIVDNEAYLTFGAPTYSVVEGGVVTIPVKRVNSTAAGVTVNYATSDGTAQERYDYVPKGGTLTFAAGVVVQNITIATVNDKTNEGVEDFLVTLSGSTLPILGGPATVSIRDNDTGGVLEFSAATYRVSESAASVTISVRRTGDTLATATVEYRTNNQSALWDWDYTYTGGTLTFAPGQVLKTFTVPILHDTDWEPTETFEVALQFAQPGPGTVLGAKSTAVVTIVDDDIGGVVQFAAASYSVAEGAGQATITVNRTGGAASAVTVDYATSDGTATQPGDYGATNGTLTFAAGQTSATFTVPIVDDSTNEYGETVALTLGSPGGGATLGARSSATLWIVDND
jgi:hypothetical protein